MKKFLADLFRGNLPVPRTIAYAFVVFLLIHAVLYVDFELFLLTSVACFDRSPPANSHCLRLPGSIHNAIIYAFDATNTLLSALLLIISIGLIRSVFNRRNKEAPTIAAFFVAFISVSLMLLIVIEYLLMFLLG